jgi:hypothetical protein
MKSSVTPSNLSVRSDDRDRDWESLVYNGILGIVGERACAIPKALSASVLLYCWGWVLLADRSCRDTVGMVVWLLFATKRELVLVRGGDGT